MRKIFLTAALIIPLVFAGCFFYGKHRNAAIEQKIYLEARWASWSKLKDQVRRAIKGYKGRAAVVIVDLDTKWRIEHDKDELIPSASIVKIPVMMAVFLASEEGKIKLDDTIELKQSDKAPGSGILKNAPAGSSYKVEDLVRFMITESDNTAANIIIDRIGINELNSYFARIGLKQTNLSRKMMDFRSRKGGVENFTTAGEMADMFEQLYLGKFINKDVSAKCVKLLAGQKIKDRIPKKLPPETTVAHKTGLENGVCHDVGIVYTEKGNFLISALTRHKYRSALASKRFISNISLFVYNYYNGL